MAAPSCPDCTTGGVIPGEPTGAISDIQGAYLAPNPSSTPSSRTVILLTDIFGLPLPNPKIIADRLANELGCDVWVPDLFNGDPSVAPDQLKVPKHAGDNYTFWDNVKMVLVLLPRILSIIRNRPSVVDQRIASFIDAIQHEKKYEKIGVIGYCFGGAAAARLGTTGLVHSVVINHPAPLSVSIIKAIKVPAAWACAEVDFTFNQKARLEAEALFKAREGKENFVKYQFRDYKGTAHGFAARPSFEFPEVKEAYEGAFKQAVDWFNETVPA